MNKVQRNSPCVCGSGKKYKKCCMNKQNKENTVTIKQAIEVLHFGLSNFPLERSNGSQLVKVKNINIINSDTVICEFLPDASDSINIKAEICYIVSFMFSFFKKNQQFAFIKNYAVKAFTDEEQEILYAMSSSDTARYISEGRSIEWYKNTIFVDNTDDHRLQQAKQKISTIEKGLRSLICNLLQEKDMNWWGNLVPDNIKNTAETFFEEKKGYCSNSGHELIEFTFLLNLKSIIVNNWDSFDTVFSSKTKFKKLIGKLNEVRKDEAHNRTISGEASEKLLALYNEILGSVSKVYPDIVPLYLVDNWHIKLREILEGYTKTIAKTDVNRKNSILENISQVVSMITRLKDVQYKLESVLIPPGKEVLHNQLVNCFISLRKSFEDMIQGIKDNDMDLFEKANLDNAEAQKRIKNFTNKYIISET